MLESAIQVCRRRKICREMNELRGRFANQEQLHAPEIVNIGWRLRTLGREMTRYFAGEWHDSGRLRNAERLNSIPPKCATGLLRTQAMLFHRLEALSREMLASPADICPDVHRFSNLFRTCDAVWIAHEAQKARLMSV